MIKPAPASSVNASANSATTKARRNPWRPRPLERRPCFNARFKFQCEVCNAGAQPHKTPCQQRGTEARKPHR